MPFPVCVVGKYSKDHAWQRYLFQLGPQAVEYKSAAPQLDVQSDSAAVVLQVRSQRNGEAAWKPARSNPNRAVRQGLRTQLGVSAEL